MRVLAFPACVAAVVALSSCDGISPSDSSIRTCHEDTLRTVQVTDEGDTLLVTTIYHDKGRCRKAA